MDICGWHLLILSTRYEKRKTNVKIYAKQRFNSFNSLFSSKSHLVLVEIQKLKREKRTQYMLTSFQHYKTKIVLFIMPFVADKKKIAFSDSLLSIFRVYCQSL